MKSLNITVGILYAAFLITVLWMSSLLTGCSPSRNVTTSQTVKDSTWVKKTVTPVDTLITIPGNKVEVSADLAELLEGRTIEKSSKNLTASLRREGDKIIANCNQEELEMIIRLQNELLEVYRLKEIEKKDTETVTKQETPWYLVPLVWIGGITLALFLINKWLKPPVKQ